MFWFSSEKDDYVSCFGWIFLRNFPVWNDFGMKNLARFFLKKVDNVSDFDFHLKNAIMFHVLAEIFLEKSKFWGCIFYAIFASAKWIMFHVLGKIWKTSLCFMFWLNLFCKMVSFEDAFFMQFLKVQSGLCFMFRGKIWKTRLCFMFWLNFFLKNKCLIFTI